MRTKDDLAGDSEVQRAEFDLDQFSDTEQEILPPLEATAAKATAQREEVEESKD